MEAKNEINPEKTISPQNLENLLTKVKAIAQGPNCDLLLRLIDLLYKHEYAQDEFFSPDDLADIQAGLDEIRRGDTVSWIEFKKENNL